MIRPQCGTVRGALAHQAAGEPWCGWCVNAERTARLSAESLPSLPGKAYAPVGDQQGARNAALLDAEVLAYETQWASERNNRGRHLRALPAAGPGAA